MTVGSNKIWRSVILRSIGAMFIGIGIVSAFVVLLSLYGVSQENTPPVTAQSQKSLILKFPENEQMLDDLSAQLAREGIALSNVEPAAGDKKPETAKKNIAK